MTKKESKRKSCRDATTPRSSSSSLVSVAQEDHLHQDAAIPGQEFACVSFVCPEDVLPRKDVFAVQKYMDRVLVPKVLAFVEAVKSEPDQTASFADTLRAELSDYQRDYSAFLSNSQAELDQQFATENPLTLTMSGFKIRGSYPDIESARKRAETLQRQDRTVDVFVAQVGAWCPFNPRPESVGDIVYDETQLNTIMKMKKEAEEHQACAYEEDTAARVQNTKREVSALEPE